MARLTSIRNSADYFKNCIKAYFSSIGKEKYNNDDDFWELVSSITFENGKISHNCPLFVTMKSYSDTHPMTKEALMWQVNFENADEIYIREIILYLIEKKEDIQRMHKATKNNEYLAAMDKFNNFLRQIKWKMKVYDIPNEIIEQFDIIKVEWQDAVSSEIEDYKHFDEPLDETFNTFINRTKQEVRNRVNKLTNGIMYSDKTKKEGEE